MVFIVRFVERITLLQRPQYSTIDGPCQLIRLPINLVDVVVLERVAALDSEIFFIVI